MGFPHITMVMVVFVKIAKTSPPCRWDQITRTEGNSTACWDCPTCPVGYGLTPQCSSYVTFDVTIKCTRCKDGVTFSDVDNVSSCKPCSICGPNEYTIRQCNATHNAICGKCKPGYYREITFDCWPCTKCCPDSTDDELVPECLSQGLPAKQSCRLNFKTEACAMARTTFKPKTSTTKKLDRSFDVNLVPTVEGVKNHTIIVVHQHHYKAASDRLWMGIGISLLVICAVGIPVIFLCKQRKRFYSQPSPSVKADQIGFFPLGQRGTVEEV